ncbi:RNA polymerase sigma-70 factor, ECF subfamily [Cyclobacterium lianum]|uniref:RNA polymerase sigma-70 factor, ECF subfamily n=1 Tax=Cyclobacterium lianum TaxID=388280 RepID=A0A1M7QL57_9BACT|nr:RNA polymerase sigma-70 factor [Cyclobacterium lianum]SHN31709.1 RNA polymerase sigma-70 factor, ECF subfamily [Cyclobacterium lianum]
MRCYKTHNDQQLLDSLREQADPKAFEAIYDKHFDALFVYVYKVMQDRATAEDLVQNVFFSLWKNAATCKVKELKPYLFGAARLQMAKEFRRSKCNAAQLEYLRQIQATHNTEEYLAAEETRKRVLHVIQGLPQKCRHVFEMSRFGFLSNREIAGKLGISVFTVENHIKKALSHLRQAIELFVLLGYGLS